MAKKVVNVIKLQIPAGGAKPSPPIGPALGAAGVLECIYSILMLKNKFIAESLNLSDPIDEAEDLVMANQLIEKKDFSSFMSNSFGFGGTNASIVVKEFN